MNEMDVAGLTPLPSKIVSPPRVAESALNFECRLIHQYDMKNAQGMVTTTVGLLTDRASEDRWL